MRKLIWAINLTIDGFADHTAGIADDELHDFFSDLLDSVDTVLFGRKTYELMADFWPYAKDDARSTESIMNFAEKYNSIHKIVFSKTLAKVTWNNTELIKDDASIEVLKLKQQNGKDLSVGGTTMASSLMKEGLIDECRFLIHPVLLGKGKKLIDNLDNKINLKLVDKKVLGSVVIALQYEKSQLGVL